MEQGERAHRFWVRGVAPTALFVLAFAIRALPFQGILVEGRTLFFGYDAYYHMRRILYSIVHFPSSLGVDPYLNHPDGARAIWTPMFDWSIAALLRPFFGHVEPLVLEQIAVWVPPAFGAATVVALYFLALRHFGAGVALLAGVVLSVLSGHFWYSQVGFIDHHAAVALATTFVLGAGMALLAQSSNPLAAGGRRWRRAVALGVADGVALLLWPGTLLHIGLVEVALLVHLMTRENRPAAVRFAREIGVVHAVAFLLLFPFGAFSTWESWGRFSPVVMSAFQPWYFGAATVFSLGCAFAWPARAAAATRGGRTISAAGIAAAVLVASALVFPGLAGAFGDGWDWIAKRDGFMEHVAESKPLFWGRDGFTWNVALVRLSTFSLLLPVALIAGFTIACRRREQSAVLLFLWWSLGLIAVTVLQKRFFNSASVAVALLFALSFREVYARLPDALRDRPAGRRAAQAALAAAAIFLLLPVLASYQPYIANLVAGWRDENPTPGIDTRRQVAMVQMANWIRAKTPTPSNWLDPTQKPSYGILAPWSLGHVLEYEARRPTVTTNFGDDIGRKNYQLARRYYQSEEGPASEILDRLRVRYVIAQETPNYLGEDPLPGSIFFALFHHDGAGGDSVTNTEQRAAVAALERHRLIFESPPLARTDPPSRSLFKVFEYVPGARIVGRAPPGSRVSATLRLRTNRQREIRYIGRTIASAAGTYALRVPYANRGGKTGMRIGGAYRVACCGLSGRVEVDEAAVTSGADVSGPDLGSVR
jgi:dolichyl-diphosphooligosaccharide--protein glycosyltransferase